MTTRNGERDSARSPPPPYNAMLDSTARQQPSLGWGFSATATSTRAQQEQPSPNERTVLLSAQHSPSEQYSGSERPQAPIRKTSGTQSQNWIVLVIAFLACMSIVAIVADAVRDGVPTAEERQQIRKEWAAEIASHDQVRLEWVHEIEQHDKRREEWAEEDRRRHEQEDIIRAGFAWDDLHGDQHCLRYGTRVYTARITNVPRTYDPVKACMETGVEIHGKTIPAPSRCEDRGCDGVFGHWVVDFAEAACRPHFSDFNDKGCTARGSGKRRFDSKLLDLQYGDDWREMCATTPVDLWGQHFDGPDMCENWGKYGVWARWDIEDPQCK